MDVEDLAEWQALERIDLGFGERRQDWRAALVAWAVVESQRGPDAEPTEISSFLPRYEKRTRKRRRRQTEAQQIAVAQAISAMVPRVPARVPPS